MRTPEEIKKGLECCTNFDCKNCTIHPKRKELGFYCVDMLMSDALTYIQQLEADNSRLSDTIRNLTELLNAAHEETAKARRERDAAVADLASIPRCKVCVNLEKDNYEEPCDSCAHIAFMGDVRGNWVWRGVCPENAEAHDEQSNA